MGRTVRRPRLTVPTNLQTVTVAGMIASLRWVQDANAMSECFDAGTSVCVCTMWVSRAIVGLLNGRSEGLPRIQPQRETANDVMAESNLPRHVRAKHFLPDKTLRPNQRIPRAIDL